VLPINVYNLHLMPIRYNIRTYFFVMLSYQIDVTVLKCLVVDMKADELIL
jgi:hypothetical protein